MRRKTRIYIILSVFAFLGLFFCHSKADIADRIAQAERRLGVRIVYTEEATGPWRNCTYKAPADEQLLRQYLKILEEEYSKYPPEYLRHSNTETIVLTEYLVFKGSRRIAVPDAANKRIFLCVVDRLKERDQKIRHILHHELFHNTEYALFGSYYSRWDEWNKLNPEGFHYEERIKKGLKERMFLADEYTAFTRPQQGFLNIYSTSAEGEDRAEIAASLMVNSESSVLSRICEEDPVLKNKVNLLKKIFKISGGI